MASTAGGVSTDGHIVLLGDSIFDNGVYVDGGPDVVAQVRARLPDGWRATLLARDGAVTSGVVDQARRIPADATLLVLSVGGNDALGASSVLERPARSVGEAMAQLVTIRAAFAERYARTLDVLAEHGLPIAVCTIYDANHPPPRHELIVGGLCLFNDVITRAAFARRYHLIDLRLLCSEPADYANPIEPSVAGGEKIAAAIVRLALEPASNAASNSIVVAHPTASSHQHTKQASHSACTTV